jgi:hypothetical protein
MVHAPGIPHADIYVRSQGVVSRVTETKFIGGICILSAQESLKKYGGITGSHEIVSC